jgi:hypothetical protein
VRVSTVAAATVALLALPIAAQQPTPSSPMKFMKAPDLQRAVVKPNLAGQLTVDQVKGKNGYGPGFAVPLGDRVTVAQLAEFSLETRDLCRLSLSVYPTPTRRQASSTTSQSATHFASTPGRLLHDRGLQRQHD